jgi:hypothetical protein
MQTQFGFILLAAYSRQPFLIIGRVYLAHDKVDWLAAISLPEVSEQFANLPAHWRVGEGIYQILLNNWMAGLIDYTRHQHY